MHYVWLVYCKTKFGDSGIFPRHSFVDSVWDNERDAQAEAEKQALDWPSFSFQVDKCVVRGSGPDRGV